MVGLLCGAMVTLRPQASRTSGLIVVNKENRKTANKQASQQRSSELKVEKMCFVRRKFEHNINVALIEKYESWIVGLKYIYMG